MRDMRNRFFDNVNILGLENSAERKAVQPHLWRRRSPFWELWHLSDPTYTLWEERQRWP